MKTKHIITIGALFMAGLSDEVVAGEYDALPVQTTMQYVDDTGRLKSGLKIIKRHNRQSTGYWEYHVFRPDRNRLVRDMLYGNYTYFMITASIANPPRGSFDEFKSEWTIVNFGEVSTLTMSVGSNVQFYNTVTVSSFAFSVSAENVTATVQTITTLIPQLTASIRYRFDYATLTAHKLIRVDNRHSLVVKSLHNDFSVDAHTADNEKITRCVAHTFGRGKLPHSAAWEVTKHRRQIAAELSKAENADMTVDGLCAWIVANYPNTPLPPTGKELVALYRATLPQRPVDESPRGNEEESES